jgi:hypothetical protein
MNFNRDDMEKSFSLFGAAISGKIPWHRKQVKTLQTT